MSGTLSQQVTDATTAIATNMTAIQSAITALQGQLQPGSQVTQAQVDALAAVKAQTDATKAALDAIAAPAA